MCLLGVEWPEVEHRLGGQQVGVRHHDIEIFIHITKHNVQSHIHQPSHPIPIRIRIRVYLVYRRRV